MSVGGLTQNYILLLYTSVVFCFSLVTKITGLLLHGSHASLAAWCVRCCLAHNGILHCAYQVFVIHPVFVYVSVCVLGDGREASSNKCVSICMYEHVYVLNSRQVESFLLYRTHTSQTSKAAVRAGGRHTPSTSSALVG